MIHEFYCTILYCHEKYIIRRKEMKSKIKMQADVLELASDFYHFYCSFLTSVWVDLVDHIGHLRLAKAS